MFAKFGLPLQTVRNRAFGGEVYTQDIDLSGQHDPSGAPPWWVLAMVFRLLSWLRKCNTVTAKAPALLEDFPRRWEGAWREACARRIGAAPSSPG